MTLPTCKILSTPKSSDMMTPLSKRPLSLRGFSLSKTPFNYLSTATCKTVSDCVRRMAQKRELGLRGLAVVHWTSACSLEIRSREIEKERKKKKKEELCFALRARPVVASGARCAFSYCHTCNQYWGAEGRPAAAAAKTLHQRDPCWWDKLLKRERERGYWRKKETGNLGGKVSRVKKDR